MASNTDSNFYLRNQYLEGGLLFSSVRQYLEFLVEDEPRGKSAFTEKMWAAESFSEFFSLLARQTVSEARKVAKKLAKSRYNIILNVDSYKISMPFQYPPNTRRVFSYIESRGGAYDKAVFVGTQAFIDEYLTVPVTHDMVDEAVEVYREHGEPFFEKGWRDLVNNLGGMLPISIRAVDEGTVVPIRNVLVTVENTHDDYWWLTTHIETALLRAVWFPTTVASRSYAARKVIRKWLEKTSDYVEALLPSRLHDFSARGVSSGESAELGGVGHMLLFAGTDNVLSLAAARRYYGARMPARSVPAAEHSTITSWGREREVDAYRNMLRLFARPGSFVSVVSDSYDIWNAIDNIWGTELRQQVIDSGATVIIRPDSGNVLTVPLEVVRRLADKFGYTTNSKGYKVLKHVAVLQGDGIDDEIVIDKILHSLEAAGFAADNIAFGMGGGLLQKLNRDTMRWAMKASAILVGEEWIGFSKDPVTDPGKKSKTGRITLVNDNDWDTVPLDGNKWRSQLPEIFRDGRGSERLQNWNEMVSRAAA